MLKAIFIVAFFIALPANAESTYCHKGALIYLSYNSNVNKSVWTKGIGSNYSYIEQGYNSLNDAIWYINNLETIGYKYNQCSTAITPTPVITPTPISTAGYNCNSGSCVYTSSNATFKFSNYQNNTTLTYNACDTQCKALYPPYTPPITPTYTYPEARTISLNYDSTNDQLNSYGYLLNLGNNSYARTGFCLFEKNYGFSCTTEIIGQNAQYNLGQFLNLNYSTTNLKRNTQYCIRAFAQNSYGKKLDSSVYDQCFYTRYDYYQTPYTPPAYSYGYKPNVRTTDVIYYPTTLQANFKGYVDNIGSYQTAKVGFCLFKQSGYYFSCEQDLPVDYSRRYNGEFVYYNFPANGLSTNTRYCIRAYGENLSGRQYADAIYDKCFDTNQYPNPYPAQQTNITITKTATNGVECQTADISIQINCQSYICSNVVVYDALSSNVSLIPSSANPGVSYFWTNKSQPGKLLVWSIGSMSYGTKTIKYRIRFNTSTDNQLIADYPDSKITYNENGIQTKNFPAIYLSPITCQTTPTPTPEPIPTPDPTSTIPETPTTTTPVIEPTPDPEPTNDCAYFENTLKDKFEYCGRMGYSNICFNGKTKTFITCMNDANYCAQRYTWVNGINCSVSSDYNNYTIKNNNLTLYGNTMMLASGYLYSGQGKAETGFAIYDKATPDDIKYFIANANQNNGPISKIINISEIGGNGKQYCSKAYYLKNNEKIFAPEERCYTIGGCYKGAFIYAVQNTQTNMFWTRLPEYIRTNTFAEMQGQIDTKVSTGAKFTQCNY